MKSIQENKHVLTSKFTYADLIKHNGNPPPRRIGINLASTFPGFYGRHDSDLFRPVEGHDLILTKSTAFLLAFRAISYELYAKAAAVFLLAFRAISYELYAKAAAVKLSEIQRKADCGRPFSDQVEVQQTLHAVSRGQQRGLRDAKKWKAEYDAAYVSGDYTNFYYLAVVFDGILPVVACGAIYPEYGFDGLPLQRISHGNEEFDHLTLNLTAYATNSIMLLGWMGRIDGPSAQFIQTFRDLPEDQKADAALRLCFEYLENIYIKPSWWEGSASVRTKLGPRITSGMIFTERKADCLVDDGAKLSAIMAKEELAE